jgi:hypothetical protein
VQEGITGALDTDLGRAARRALELDPRPCRERALQSGWDACAHEFEGNLVSCHGSAKRWRSRARPLTGSVLS